MKPYVSFINNALAEGEQQQARRRLFDTFSVGMFDFENVGLWRNAYILRYIVGRHW